MRFFVSHHATEQYSLIPHTDREIVTAVRHFFPEARNHLFGRDNAADARQFLAMRQACGDVEPMASLDTTGQIPFHTLPFRAEQIKLTYLSDAPFGFLPALQAMPEGAYVGYSDRRFLQFHKDMGLPIRPVFLPHGGPAEVNRGKHPQDRSLPAVFIGKVENPSPVGLFDHPLIGGDPALAALFRRASENAYEEGVEIYTAFNSAAKAVGMEPLTVLPLQVLCDILWSMQHWVEAQRRLEVLRAFANKPLHIFGPVDKHIPGVTDCGHHFHGPVKGAQALAVMGEARLLLNAVFVLSGGSHERIWFALASGCLPVTDPSDFLAETYGEGDLPLIDYRDPAGTAERVWSLAQTPDAVAAILDRALPIYTAHHTWICRLRNVFRQIPELAPFVSA